MAQLDNDAVQFERHAVRLEVVRTEVCRHHQMQNMTDISVESICFALR